MATGASSAPGVRRARSPRGEGASLRESLIEAATELMGELGDAGRVSVRAVTARAGVSPMALYLHFPDRDELIKAVIDRAFVELRRYVLAADAVHEGDPEAQLRAGCRAYLSFALERPGLYRVLFGVQRSPRPPTPETRPRVGREAFDDLVRGVGRVLAADIDPWPVAVNVWAQLHGLASLRFATPGFPWPPAEELLEAALDGLVLGAAREAK